MPAETSRTTLHLEEDSGWEVFLLGSISLRSRVFSGNHVPGKQVDLIKGRIGRYLRRLYKSPAKRKLRPSGWQGSPISGTYCRNGS